MQLIRSLVGVVALTSLAAAENRADFQLNYFTEPARSQRLNVVIPSVGASVDVHPNVTVNFGYAADIVSGATPRVYGGGIDAITSATKFKDVRHAPHAGIELRVGPVAIDAGYQFSTENDYRSHQLNVGAKVDLWGKNTTFLLSYSHNWDEVCDVDNSGAAPVDRRALSTSRGCFTSHNDIVLKSVAINGYAAGLSQVFHPKVSGDLTTTFEVIEGFQSNPYRLVSLFGGTVEAQETVPNLRQRFAVQARLNFAVPRARGAVHVLGRFYDDTWGIKAVSAEASWDEYVMPSLLLSVRARFYQQGRAVFYRDAGQASSYDNVGPVGQYFTGDREMSPYRDYLAGLKLTYIKVAGTNGKLGKVLQEVDVNGKLELIGYQAETKLPPNLARSDGFIDAIIAQLGVVLLW